MVYALLIAVASVLLLTFLTSYVLIREAVPDKNLRKVLLFSVILTPPLFVWALLRFLFVRPKPVPFSEELGRIEDEIENERARIFGGKVLHPSISERWRLSYMYAVQKAASKLDPPLASALKIVPSVGPRL
jgi:hypothetical protein